MTKKGTSIKYQSSIWFLSIAPVKGGVYCSQGIINVTCNHKYLKYEEID